MTNNNGWVKLHRKILDNPLASKPTWAWLWVVLLLLANHDDENTFIWNGQEMKQHRGQFITGRKKLNEITGIPESTIEDILRYLENSCQIRQQKTTKYRLITILKWEEYQQSDNKATTKQQQSDTIKNLKKLRSKEEERGTPSQDAISFFKSEEPYKTLLDLFSKDRDSSAIEKEFKKFILYWTELNKTGTKQKWEQQDTFEVKRRLLTWLSRANQYSEKTGTKSAFNTPNYII